MKMAEWKSDLTYQEVHDMMEREHQTESPAEIRTRTNEYMDEHFKGGYEKPVDPVIDNDELESLVLSLSDSPEDEKEFFDDLVEQYDEPTAHEYLKQAKKQNSPDYKFKKLLSEDDVRLCDKMKREHPERNWTYEKLYNQNQQNRKDHGYTGV